MTPRVDLIVALAYGVALFFAIFARYVAVAMARNEREIREYLFPLERRLAAVEAHVRAVARGDPTRAITNAEVVDVVTAGGKIESIVVAPLADDDRALAEWDADFAAATGKSVDLTAPDPTRVVCVVCRKTTAPRWPKNGDGTLAFPRRHKGPDGEPCPGNVRAAEWPDPPGLA